MGAWISEPVVLGPILFFLIAAIGVMVWAWYGAIKLGHLHAVVMSFHDGGDTRRLGDLVEEAALGARIKAEKRGPLALRTYRARASEYYARCVMAVEVLPQLGLLGTVLGLMFAFLTPEGTLAEQAPLGFALVTTLGGLTGSVLVRWFVEGPAHGKLALILEFMEDEDLVRLISAEGARAAGSDKVQVDA